MISLPDTITGLTADTRDVRRGYLFAALKGVTHDGVDFIPQAIANGATYILAPTGTKATGAELIESDNPRLDFAKLASAFYKSQPDYIIAITGTNGKTSVADFVRQIFELKGLKSASIGTLGLISNHVSGQNGMTTPDPVTLHKLLADLKQADVNHVAMEASSHGLDQYRLDGVKPKVAAFTNLSQDHLDYHETMENYFDAKARLFTEVLSDDGMAIVNLDDEWGLKLAMSLREGKAAAAIQNSENNKNSGFPRLARNDVILFGKHENADLRLISQTPTATGQDIQIQYKGQTHDIHLPLIGLFQAYNVMCAVACCIAIGIEDVFEILSQLKGVKGRVELAAVASDRAAYIDYAHTPDALEQVLTALRPHVENRLICVFGAGGDRDKTKRPLMGKAVATHADIAIITDDNPRSEDPAIIRADIQTACPNAMNIGGREDAIKQAIDMMNDGDVLLVAGKGHEQGQMIGDINHPFDDLKITQKWMTHKYD